VVAADMQGAQRGRVQQREIQRGGDHVPGEGRMADGLPRQLVPARGHRARGEDRDADQGVGAVPVAAGDPCHHPGERPGQESGCHSSTRTSPGFTGPCPRRTAPSGRGRGLCTAAVPCGYDVFKALLRFLVEEV
jgi:hypothetical protein